MVYTGTLFLTSGDGAGLVKESLRRSLLLCLALLASVAVYAGTPKNIIVVIGDGMGPQQIGLLNAYVKYAPNSIYQPRRVSEWERLANRSKLALASTEAAEVLVTDSAASATQLASGQWARPEMVGTDALGKATQTLLAIAQRNGKATGMVTDTRISHATPAGFATHQRSRGQEQEIAAQLLDSGAAVMLGAGLDYWLPQGVLDSATGVRAKRTDKRDLWAEAAARGYQRVTSRAELRAAQGNKILGLFAGAAMLNGIEETRWRDSPARTIPTLLEMTEKAVSVLEHHEQGFFLLIEAGMIDWAAHDNDTGALLHEMIKLDRVLGYLNNWSKDRDDTLIVVTADHETGGFGFSFSRFAVAGEITLSGEIFAGAAYTPSYNYGDYAVLDKLYAQTAPYHTLFGWFDALPADQQTPSALMQLVNQHTQFPISEADAQRILLTEPNHSPIAGHPYLQAERFPLRHEYKEFFVYGAEGRSNILASVVGKFQNTVWATGTHTSTPVPVIINGPDQATRHFASFLHTTDLGRTLMALLGG